MSTSSSSSTKEETPTNVNPTAETTTTTTNDDPSSSSPPPAQRDATLSPDHENKNKNNSSLEHQPNTNHSASFGPFVNESSGAHNNNNNNNNNQEQQQYHQPKNPELAGKAKSLYRESLDQYLKEQQTQVYGIRSIEDQLQHSSSLSPTTTTVEGDNHNKHHHHHHICKNRDDHCHQDPTTTSQQDNEQQHHNENKNNTINNKDRSASSSGGVGHGGGSRSTSATPATTTAATRGGAGGDEATTTAALTTPNRSLNHTVSNVSSVASSSNNTNNSNNSTNNNDSSGYHRQTIRGRRDITETIIQTEHGEIPAKEYFNIRHRLRTVIPIEESLSLFQLWVLTPILNAFMWLLTNVFFREVDVIGLENIPQHGPIVFYGNHQNQFMDAVMIRAHCGRPVRFIIAEKSMKRPVIGQFARLMGVVPVVRPQDVPSVNGSGKIISIIDSTVEGNEETKFTTEVHPGDVIQWSVVGSSEKLNAQVKTIESNNKLTLTLPVEASNSVNNKPTSFKVSRRIDHSEMYAQVYKTLENDGSIGVFPEGGSHDRTSLLPLKAGVALFSLGAAERGIVPAVIPVGLTYFYGHKFRSRAHIEFGEPILPPPEIVEKFSTDKRNATGEWLKILETALRDVTINCEDYNTLKFIHNFRRLYQDPSIRLETIDYLRLTRRLAIITTEFDHDPDFAEFRAKVENYIDFCNALFVRDAQAATLSNLKKNVSILLFFRRVGVLFVLFFTLVPFFIIAGPVGIISQLASEAHARTALSASSVKVVGADVKASYKIITGFALFPLMCGVVATIVYHYTDSFRSAATVFLATPMAMYVSLHLVHEFILELYAALPLFISLVSNHKQFIKLHERRTRLVAMAREMVSKFDPSLDSEMSVYEGVSSPTGPAPSFFSLRHRSRASPGVAAN